MNTVFFSFFISNGWRFKQVTHPILRIVDFKETNNKKKIYFSTRSISTPIVTF